MGGSSSEGVLPPSASNLAPASMGAESASIRNSFILMVPSLLRSIPMKERDLNIASVISAFSEFTLLEPFQK